MSKGGKLALVIVGAVLVVAGFGWWTVGFLLQEPPTVQASTGPAGSTNVVLQTVGSIGFGDHPTWVSYLARNPQGSWVHTTLLQVPAYSLIHVTLYEYDGATTLRNNFWALPQGLVGPLLVNGRPVPVANANNVAHTFAIPDLGVSVPLVATPSSTLCAVAPCATSQPHTVIQFAFRTFAPGEFRWQCFIPCGLSFVDGNGGPMQTLGYMMGWLKVS